jgi:hypothetical protein
VAWIDLEEGYDDLDALESAQVKIRSIRRRFSIRRRSLELVNFGVGSLEIVFANHFYNERCLEIIVLEKRTVLEAVNFAIFTQDAGVGRGILSSLH